MNHQMVEVGSKKKNKEGCLTKFYPSDLAYSQIWLNLLLKIIAHFGYYITKLTPHPTQKNI
jgi:hypothetical protein